jgi:hypothetical protein
MIDAIKKVGGNPRYTEYPHEGHNIWDKVSTTPGLLDWLLPSIGSDCRNESEQGAISSVPSMDR